MDSDKPDNNISIALSPPANELGPGRVGSSEGSCVASQVTDSPVLSTIEISTESEPSLVSSKHPRKEDPTNEGSASLMTDSPVLPSNEILSESEPSQVNSKRPRKEDPTNDGSASLVTDSPVPSNAISSESELSTRPRKEDPTNEGSDSPVLPSNEILMESEPSKRPRIEDPTNEGSDSPVLPSNEISMESESSKRPRKEYPTIEGSDSPVLPSNEISMESEPSKRPRKEDPTNEGSASQMTGSLVLLSNKISMESEPSLVSSKCPRKEDPANDGSASMTASLVLPSNKISKEGEPCLVGSKRPRKEDPAYASSDEIPTVKKVRFEGRENQTDSIVPDKKKTFHQKTFDLPDGKFIVQHVPVDLKAIPAYVQSAVAEERSKVRVKSGKHENASCSQNKNKIISSSGIKDASDVNTEVVQKKCRKRKKHVINLIQKLLEFYFSRAHLNKSTFMKESMNAESFIDLEIFLSFNQIKCLTDDLNLVKYAVNNSKILELSPDKLKVRTTLDITPKEDEDELACTIFVDQLSRNHTHEWVWNRFSQYGPVEYVSMQRYKDTLKSKGFAFVEFDTPASAQKALSIFGAYGEGPPHRRKMIPDISPVHHLHDYIQQLEANDLVPPPPNNGELRYGEDHEDQSPPLVEEDGAKDLFEADSSCHSYGEFREPRNDYEAAESLSLGEQHLDAGVTGSRADNISPPLIGSQNDNSIPVAHDSTDENNSSKDIALEVDLGVDAQPDPPHKQQKKKKKKNVHRRIRLKNREMKQLLEQKSNKFEPEPIRLHVMSKQEWQLRRKKYLMEQKSTLKNCKHIMKLLQQEEQESNPDEEKPAHCKVKPLKQLNCIVKITLDNPLESRSEMMAGIRDSGGPSVAFIEATMGERIIYVRFHSPDKADDFLKNSVWSSKSSLVVWDEEDRYWLRVHADWKQRVMPGGRPVNKKRKRGKQVVLARWKKVQGKLELLQQKGSHEGPPKTPPQL